MVNELSSIPRGDPILPNFMRVRENLLRFFLVDQPIEGNPGHGGKIARDIAKV